MSEPRLRIVTESLNDVRLLRKLLYRELASETKFYASQGLISTATVGRNLLVHDGGPVLLVIDSDTLNIERQREYEETAQAALEAAYGRDFTALRPLCKVFTFRPMIEVVFFEAPKAVELLLGKAVDERTIDEGTAKPKEILQKLCGLKESTWLETLIRKIDEPVQELLRQGSQAAQLREAVASILPAAAK